MARFWSEQSFSLVVDVTLLNVGVGQDRRTVYAVKHLLLFEQRQILADRHLRDAEHVGQLRNGQRCLLV